jgi:hypothetical protein
MKNKFGFIALCFLFVLPVFVHAQDSAAIIQNKNVTIMQDSGITELLYKYKEYNQKKEFTEGYRIQIMYTDIRDEVYTSKGKTYQDFPDLPSYVEYEEPYYKLRLGDFKTRLEATYYLQQVNSIYPGAFIVKDKIRIRQ